MVVLVPCSVSFDTDVISKANHLPCVLISAMSSLKRSYEQWVRREYKWLLPLLDTARNLTIFLPGRFADGELRSEALYATLNLLTVYHDHILHRARAVTCELQCGPQTTYIRQLQTVLTFLHYTEVLLEMATNSLTRHLPADERQKRKWQVLSLIEGIKALCRLCMLVNNGGRMLIPPTQQQLNMQTLANQHTHNLTYPSTSSTSAVLPSPAPTELISLYLSHGRNNTHPHGKFSLPTAPPPPASPATTVAETLYITRPLAYCLLRLHSSPNSGAYLPFIVSLAMDVSSRLLYGRWERLSMEQRVELSRRMLWWSLYLLRSPVFETFVQSRLVRVGEVVGKVPLLGMIGTNVVDLILSLQQHYFYTSVS